MHVCSSCASGATVALQVALAFVSPIKEIRIYHTCVCVCHWPSGATAEPPILLVFAGPIKRIPKSSKNSFPGRRRPLCTIQQYLPHWMCVYMYKFMYVYMYVLGEGAHFVLYNSTCNVCVYVCMYVCMYVLGGGARFVLYNRTYNVCIHLYSCMCWEEAPALHYTTEPTMCVYICIHVCAGRRRPL